MEVIHLRGDDGAEGRVSSGVKIEYQEGEEGGEGMGGDWLGRDGTQCRVPGERLVCGKGPHLNIMSHEKTVPSCQLHSDKEKV